jgi:uncharacterized protein (DUF1810 family)
MTLSRFVNAQERTYEAALSELRAGRKRTHWMWFVFPQLKGLGHSAMAEQYGIASLAEAKSYLEHPILGPRLLECTRAVLSVPNKTATEILGDTDAMKLRSSMTLFAIAAPQEPVFQETLDKYYEGKKDDLTRRLLAPG